MYDIYVIKRYVDSKRDKPITTREESEEEFERQLDVLERENRFYYLILGIILFTIIAILAC